MVHLTQSLVYLALGTSPAAPAAVIQQSMRDSFSTCAADALLSLAAAGRAAVPVGKVTCCVDAGIYYM
jgi:hypothetical protein